MDECDCHACYHIKLMKTTVITCDVCRAPIVQPRTPSLTLTLEFKHPNAGPGGRTITTCPRVNIYLADQSMDLCTGCLITALRERLNQNQKEPKEPNENSQSKTERPVESPAEQPGGAQGGV